MCEGDERRMQEVIQLLRNNVVASWAGAAVGGIIGTVAIAVAVIALVS